MRAVSPVIFEPERVTELVTITAMYLGRRPSGASSSEPAVQRAWHVGVRGSAAKPLKLDGAGPPLSEFFFHHFGLQNVTSPVALRSPITKAPRGRNEKISTFVDAVAVLPPSSVTVVLIV